MFGRLVYESFRRQKRRKLLAGVAITLGVGVATAMIAVATDIGDKISRELRTYGANLIVTPQEDTLDVQIGGVDLKPPSDGRYLEERQPARNLFFQTIELWQAGLHYWRTHDSSLVESARRMAR